jgi:hypothetical protein
MISSHGAGKPMAGRGRRKDNMGWSGWEEFGGAVYLSSVANATIACCQFDGNTAEYIVDGTDPVCDRGMGGAVASLESTLVVEESAFSNNKALVVSLGTPAQQPPVGSAGGGGDAYVKKGAFKLLTSRSSSAVAGFPRPFTDPDHINGANTPEYFTGDGGSILVHCPDTGTALEIRDSTFERPKSYGNGGAICISYNSSTIGRAYYTTNPFTGSDLDGVCSGIVSNVRFQECNGGWQGGAISANGSGVLLTIQDCTFDACVAGGAHRRDGKGGATSAGGGLRTALQEPQNRITVDHCTILGCTATGNGGALYTTIRGLMQIQNQTSVRNCVAQNLAQGFLGKDWAGTEGIGGGVYASAGGKAVLSGECVLEQNTANSSGGGLAVKSARADLNGTVTIRQNSASGTAASGWGNGGGIYVTTCAFEGHDGTAAWTYSSDGEIFCSSSGVSVTGNTANRLGGGLCAGIPNIGGAGTHVQMDGASVGLNVAPGIVLHLSALRSASQIATENVNLGVMTPLLQFMGTTVTGISPATDIGIFMKNSINYSGTPTFVAGTLFVHSLAQP